MYSVRWCGDSGHYPRTQIQIPIPGTHQLPVPLPRPSHGSPPLVENEECAQRLIWCRSHATEFRRDKYLTSLRHGSAASHLPLYPRWGRGWGHSSYSAPGWSLQIDTEECCDVLHACISTYLDIYRYTRYTFWHGHCCCCRQLCGKWAGGLNDPVPRHHRPLGCMTPVRK